MVYELKFADVGEGVHEGEVLEIYVKVGDAVKVEQELLEVHTEKVTTDITSPVSGTVTEILCSVGDTIEVGHTIIKIDTAGSSKGKAEAPPSQEEDPSLFKPSKPMTTRRRRRRDQSQPKTQQVVVNERVLASPAVRRRAREEGIDLTYVKGSGPAGRIRHEDLDGQKAPSQPTRSPVSTGRPKKEEKLLKPGSETRIPLKGTRKTIAKSMRLSKDTAAHYTYFEEVDMSALDQLRESLKPMMQEKGIRVTYVALVMKLLVPALRKYPLLNSQLDQDSNEIILRDFYNIGISVDTDDGLVVPVVKHVEQKTIWEVAEDVIRWYDIMVQVRTLDTKGIRLQRQGRVGFHILTTGQEAHIGIAAALNPEDWIFPAYREHGAALFRELPLENVVDHLFANERDSQKGRRLPGLFGEKSINFVNPSAPIGTQIVQAAGAAYAAQEFNKGEVNAVFFGDGATSSNDFHSGVNFAGVFKSPTLFVCMNNQFAISVPIEQQTAAEKIVDKAIGYGVPGVQVDGNDIFAMYEAATEAVERARKGDGPTFIEAYTYRLGPHTSSDDPSRYRDDDDVENWQQKDPMVRFKNYLISRGIMTEDEEKAMWDKYDELINKLIEAADARPKPAMETMFTDVYEELPWHLKEQWEEVQFFTEDN